MASAEAAVVSIELLYFEDLGEALEVGVGVRRIGALFVLNGHLYPVQFLVREL